MTRNRLLTKEITGFRKLVPGKLKENGTLLNSSLLFNVQIMMV